MPADGRLLQITPNVALFSLYGTAFGGDGINTFGIPNLKNQAPNGLTYYICAVNGIFPDSAPPQSGRPASYAIGPVGTPSAHQQRSTAASITFKSTPEGAEITVGGRFVGSTPSTLRLFPGDHVITMQKTGYTLWKRTITLTADGVVTIDANLEK
jgi:hypothetical protein